MLTPGRLLQDRYRIERSLGQGGMGGVYLATHVPLHRTVAIKELHMVAVPQDGREAAVRRFHSEAQILSQLHHSGLPRVYDFFEVDGEHYLVMDFILGETLEARLTREARIPEARVLGWAGQICEVLHFLHTQDPPVVFRDLKPSNIMLAEDGRIKLIDFGIAKLFDTTTGEGTDAIARGMGTPGYAAPEQYVSGTDARTDVYALGATLYTLLSGETPTSALEVAMGSTEIIPLRVLNPNVTDRTARAIREMMDPNRSTRIQSVARAMEALGFSAPADSETAPAIAEDAPLEAEPERSGVGLVGIGTLVFSILLTFGLRWGWDTAMAHLYAHASPYFSTRHVSRFHPIPPPMEGRGVLVRLNAATAETMLYLDAYEEAGKKYFCIDEAAGLTREQAVFRIGQTLIATHTIDGDSTDWMESLRAFEEVTPGMPGGAVSLNEILDRLTDVNASLDIGPGVTTQYRGTSLQLTGAACPFFRIEAAPDGANGVTYAFNGHSGLSREDVEMAVQRTLCHYGELTPQWTPQERSWWHRDKGASVSLDDLLDQLHNEVRSPLVLGSGQILWGRYVVARMLGFGGMGEVYLATHVESGLKVAIKRMSATGQGMRARDLVQIGAGEAEILSSVSHPHLVRLFEFVEEDNCGYLVMDYIVGDTLHNLLKAGRPPVTRVLGWMDQICDAIEYLHARTPPILYRDLKPANLMLEHGDHIRLIDFGLSRPADRGTSLNIKGAGTDGYAPMEQMGIGHTDVRSDVYSLGATLYALLTTQPPPNPLEINLAGLGLTAPSQHNPEVPTALDDVVFRMMAFRKEDRYQTIEEARQALRAVHPHPHADAAAGRPADPPDEPTRDLKG